MVKEKENYDALLVEYRSIWNNRLLAESEKNSEEIVKEAIKRELLDENSHPRIRKSRFEKYYSSVKRVMESTIASEAKFLLIELYIQIMEELSEERK